MTLKRIYVAGHRGMVGSALVRALQDNPGIELITASRAELDLLDQPAVSDFVSRQSPDVIYIAAARVGGIHANNAYPAEFIYENLATETNLIHAAHTAGVQQLLSLGSSCIYPKHAPQPMREEALLTGLLEPTNEPYAIAKIAGIKLCESYNRQYGRDYRSVMPTNLYGPGDNFHPTDSHVIPGLIRRFHEAKINGDPRVVVWGTGEVRREFLHVDDLARACVQVMETSCADYAAVTEPMCSHINVGTGQDVTIRELAEQIAEVVGFEGELIFDNSKPDGTPRKLLDNRRMESLGWSPSVFFPQGLVGTYEWFLSNGDAVK
ncbi:GDP-L-fucose synthase [Spiribacter sp. 221]|uniref:GDP-L-fucose synthase n=1 Tax=Spiribacter onubensis TaxID=3122420 RepID=UPI00349FABA2